MIGLDHFHKFNDIDVVFKQFDDFYLIFHEWGQFGDLIKLFQGYHFDCHIYLGIDVECFEYFPILPLAEVVCESVVVYDFDHSASSTERYNLL